MTNEDLSNLWLIYHDYRSKEYGYCRADKWLKADFDAYNRIALLKKSEAPPSYSILAVLPTKDEAINRLKDFAHVTESVVNGA